MPKKIISKRGKRNRRIAYLTFALLVLFLTRSLWVPLLPKHHRALQDEKIARALPKKVHLEVPLIKQMAEPKLYNGCEVISLAMLLNYKGIEVSKIELANQLPSVPLQYDNGLHGNPNQGFVGDINGVDPGYSVYHKPIAKLASRYLPKNMAVKDLTGQSFVHLLHYLSKKDPIWIITTTNYQPSNNMTTWKTPTGKVRVSWDVHSVVMTGYSKTKIFVNDPYGKKDYSVDRKKFIKAWQQMGRQAVTIVKKHSI